MVEAWSLEEVSRACCQLERAIFSQTGPYVNWIELSLARAAPLPYLCFACLDSEACLLRLAQILCLNSMKVSSCVDR